MRPFATLAAALALALGGAAADEPKPRPKPTLPKGTPAEQVKALIRQYDEAAADFTKRYKTAVTEAEQEKLFELYFPTPDDYAILLVQIADPGNLLMESSHRNNVSETYLALPSGRVLGHRVGVSAP